MVPIELHQQLDQIKRYVQQNVIVANEYFLHVALVGCKSLWQQPLMYISASLCCNVLQLNRVRGSYDSVDIRDTTFSRGKYTDD